MKRKNQNDIFIEWDDEKNQRNIAKHGISFLTASYVFADISRIELYDTEHSEYEDRFITIGFVGDLLFVVYTERDEVIRLISARRATKREEEFYYEYYKSKNTRG